MLKLYSRFTVKGGGFTTCGSLPHQRIVFNLWTLQNVSVLLLPWRNVADINQKSKWLRIWFLLQGFFPFAFRFGALLYQSRQSFVCSRPVSVMDHQFFRPPVRLLSVLCQLSAWLMPRRLFGWTLILGIAGLPSSSALRDNIKSLRRGAEGLTSPAGAFICWPSAGGESALCWGRRRSCTAL